MDDVETYYYFDGIRCEDVLFSRYFILRSQDNNRTFDVEIDSSHNQDHKGKREEDVNEALEELVITCVVNSDILRERIKTGDLRVVNLDRSDIDEVLALYSDYVQKPSNRHYRRYMEKAREIYDFAIDVLNDEDDVYLDLDDIDEGDDIDDEI